MPNAQFDVSDRSTNDWWLSLPPSPLLPCSPAPQLPMLQKKKSDKKFAYILEEINIQSFKMWLYRCKVDSDLIPHLCASSIFTPTIANNWQLTTMKNVLYALLLIVATTLFVAVATGLPLMLIWNAVIPGIFPTVRPIGFLQAIGLIVICTILFKSFSF